MRADIATPLNRDETFRRGLATQSSGGRAKAPAVNIRLAPPAPDPSTDTGRPSLRDDLWPFTSGEGALLAILVAFLLGVAVTMFAYQVGFVARV